MRASREWRDNDAVQEDEDARDAVLEALWARVTSAWDDEAAHASLLDHAVRSQRLPEIAGRYRAIAEDPEKAALAKKKLDGIVIAATQMLVSMKTPKPGKVPLPITLTAFAVCMVMLGWLALAIWGRQ
jgi:hypothetical protein